MHLRLDHSSGEPIYRQIVEQIKYRIAAGSLGGSDKLPSIRALAGQLKINSRTVVRAYEELAHANLVVMKQGQGVFVTDHREAVAKSIREKVIAEQVRRLLAEASRMGAGSEEVAGILREVANEMESDK